jgi:hypothetical protein
MLRRGRAQATMRALVLENEWRVGVDGSLMVLCTIEGSVGVDSEGARAVLEALDSAMVESREITLRPAGRALLAVISILG